MKSTLFSLSLLLAAVSLRAQDPGKARWILAADFKIVSLPQDLALTLVPALQDEATAPDGHAALRAALADGRARLIDWSRGQISDSRILGSVTENVFYFPIEWNKVFLGPGSGAFPAPTRPVNNRPSGSLLPTTLESKNLGSSFDLSGFADDDGKTIHVSYQSQRTQLAKFISLHPAPTLSGLTIHRDLPRFEIHTTGGTLNAPSGRWLVIGTFKSQNLDRTIDLHLLRVTAVPTGHRPIPTP